LFEQLLVPLDGSNMAESVLPAVSTLARRMNVTVTLLHVIEKDAPREVHGDLHLTDPAEARMYLNKVAAEAFPSDVCVERHVHTAAVSDVARSIVSHSRESGGDLIVMSTHGRGGLRDWLFGSIAQQVIANGTAPVLLMRPKEAAAGAFTCRRVLIPLDGDEEHEQALSTAIHLARICGSTLHLILVVPTRQTLKRQRAATARLLPSATSALLDMALASGKEYLDHQVSRLSSLHFAATAEIMRGDPATAISNAADRTQADLIVLATHRKTGSEAFWSESVAPQVSNRSHRPLLLVPLP
jgi:nucleotide-binding universal stress UspA family protein